MSFSQQINLVSDEFRGGASHKKALSVAATAFGLLAVLGAVGWWQGDIARQLEDKVQLAQTQVDAFEHTLESNATEADAADTEELLDQQIKELSDVVLNKTLELQALESTAFGSGKASEWLRTLSVQKVPGVWFKTIDIFPTDKHMNLEGYAQQPQLLSQLVEKLANAELTQNLQFTQAEVNAVADQKSLIQFRLNTRERAEGGSQ